MKAICYSKIRDVKETYLETINGYNVYKGKLDDNDYCLFQESSSVLWLIGDYKRNYIERKESLVNYFNNPEWCDIEQREKTELMSAISKANDGISCRISNGAAEFFGMIKEAEDAKAKYAEIQAEKDREKQAKREAYELEQAAKREQAYNEALNDYKSGKPVNAMDFVWICERNNIDIPLKTHGWLNKVCCSVYAKGSYSYNRDKGGKSQSIFTLIKRVNETVEYTGEYVTD